MKNLLIAITALLTISACNNNKSESRDIQLLTDSTAYLNNMYGDTSATLEAEPVEQPVSREIKSVTTSSRAATQTKTASSSSANNSGANNSGTQTTQTTEKKGWSSAAKGAVIGAGAGAVGGAIISKKKPVKGAVIGGAVGAAGGYIIGKDIDKRKGR